MHSVARVVERRGGGTAIGWVRMDLREVIERERLDEAAVASDVRVQMRSDGGARFAARTEWRERCHRPLVDGACR